MNEFAKPIDQVFKEFETSKQGLASSEADIKLKKYGLNILERKKKISPLKIFFNQFKSFIVAILIAATIISAYLGYREYTVEGTNLVKHMLDAIVIFVILMLNAMFGFIQEYNAEKSIEALKKLTSLKAKVIRNGKVVQIDATKVVSGDILDLEEGNKIPADARVYESINLETQEASLTGESTPVEKHDAILHESAAIGDRKNMVFSSTIITKGRGKAIVTATGMHSEIGKISKLIEQASDELTPLQLRLKDLGKTLGMLTIAICIFVFAFGSLKTGEYVEMFMAAIALAVAAIPEGLPAVVTISLAMGVKRMIKRNALFRTLPSVETLGSTTVICSDKTGTLTKNQMTVQKVYVNEEFVNVTGSGHNIQGKFSSDPSKFRLLLQTGALCNDSSLENGKVIGDPTEAALIVSAAKAGLTRVKLKTEFPRIDEIPFDSKRKLMTTVHKTGSRKIAFTKGAPDILLNKCNKIYINNKVRPLTLDDKKRILAANENLAKSALRVLGFACKFLRQEKATEDNLIFIGLQGMIDPAREEVRPAIEKCRHAGIKVVMITGDHKLTAEAIGRKLGLTGKVLTGQEIDKMPDLHNIVEEVSIYARVSPEHKMRIISALRKNGHVVSMTGDGVNDAPALKDADIGVAMGVTGTDVAKEASDMILTDDNFASIVNAIEEGRTIYDNIKKFVQYLLSSNLGEVFTIFTAIMIGLPLPLIALQILWINLMTDGLPALALGVDPAEPQIMAQQPRKRQEHIINKSRGINLFFVGIIIMLGTLGIFRYYEGNLTLARTIAFTTLMMFQMFNVINSRSEFVSSFKIKANYWLYGAILSSIILQIIVIYTPLGPIFHTTPLALIDWGYILLVSASVLIFGEIVKLFRSSKVRV